MMYPDMTLRPILDAYVVRQWVCWSNAMDGLDDADSEAFLRFRVAVVQFLLVTFKFH